MSYDAVMGRTHRMTTTPHRGPGRPKASGWSAKDLDHLHALHQQSVSTANSMRAQVAALRDQGCPWSVIGEAVGGITKQAAWEKFGRETAPRRYTNRPDTEDNQ